MRGADMTGDSIPLSVPNLSDREIELVTNAVTDGWVSTAGRYVGQFEQDLADYLNVDGAAACQSGTAALHVAMILANVAPGDLVIVPALTFIAAVNPIRYVGADPVFMDCDSSLCIDPAKLNQFCEDECVFDGSVLRHKLSGRKISAIVVVHVFGNMADMVELMGIAQKFHLAVIEDATEALGTYYLDGPFRGKFAGTIGDFGAFSFNGNKIITSGGGGMIVAKDSKLLHRAKHLTTQAKADTLYYEHDEVGFNYRLTNLQAALGVAQLEKIEQFIDAKNANYDLYKHFLEVDPSYKLLPFRNGVRSNKWFYSVECSGGKVHRDRLIKGLNDRGVQTRPIWGLINEQTPYVGELAYKIDSAKKYHDGVINIPCSTGITESEIIRVVDCMKEIAL